ncbi:hypothetical protein JP75_06560 [Devosia riboflavina]|uniref:Uncharacterized protein n=1 Tax=Devosia riboflavina TaxID=46914 RepID=A0A087M4C4_9HYPH|nr:hypothetical protein JP75_06560 [Devosia riboflavina]
MGTTLDLTTRPRNSYQAAKDISSRHFPGGDCPPMLLADIFTALSEAQHRGFEECLALLGLGPSGDNDNGEEEERGKR